MQVVNSLKSRIMLLPVYGAAADLAVGALVMPGVTAETNLGVLINATAASNADAVGVLQELHDYSESGDALVAGTAPWYFLSGTNKQMPARAVELIDTATLVKVPYDLTSKADVASYSAPTVTITNLEDNIDTSFLYVMANTGIGQIEFVATSAAGSCAVETAFATALDATSDVVKVLRLFHQVVVWVVAAATVETKLGTTAAAGTGRALILGNHIVRNGLDQFLDPHIHGGLTGLNSLAQLELYSVVHIANTAFHPID